MSVFIDTNVLMYAAAVDYNPEKNRIANELLAKPECVLSAQCLNEFIFQSTRETRRRHLPLDGALAFVATLRCFPIIEVDLALIDRASDVCRRTRYKWWDCLIVAAAITAGCDTLATEDLQHGRVIDGVRIANPFRELA